MSFPFLPVKQVVCGETAVTLHADKVSNKQWSPSVGATFLIVCVRQRLADRFPLRREWRQCDSRNVCYVSGGGGTVFRRKNVCFGYWYIWVSFERSSCRRAACHPYWPSELMDGWRRYLFWVMLDSYPQEKLVNFSVSKLETNTGTKTSQCGIMLPKQRCCHSLLIFPPLYDFFFYPFNSRFFS